MLNIHTVQKCQKDMCEKDVQPGQLYQVAHNDEEWFLMTNDGTAVKVVDEIGGHTGRLVCKTNYKVSRILNITSIDATQVFP